MMLFEYYSRPPRTLCRFVTKLLEEYYGRKIRFFCLTRYASVFVSRDSRFLACNIYVSTGGFYALCVGDFYLLDDVKKKVPIRYVICREDRCPEGELVHGAKTMSGRWLLLYIR